jgi:hypothetical protein
MSQLQTIGRTATTVHTDKDGITRVIYHSTPVVSFDDNKITLNTGGWSTNTTKTRMNQASNQFNLGYQVYQKDFNWFVVFKDKTIEYNGYELTLNR